MADSGAASQPRIHKIRLAPYQTAVRNLNKAIVVRKSFPQIIDMASAALDELFNTQMLELLEIRAYAYSTQGKLYSAIADAQRMIGYAPTSSIGYLCKANIYAMYGYQIRAIEAYDEGLNRSTASSHPCTAIYHQWCHEQLEDARAKAVTHNDNRIDIIAKLPVKVAHSILARLSQASAGTCLYVSNVWRKLIINCAGAWEDVVVSDSTTNNLRAEMLVILKIVPLIKCLTIDTSNTEARSTLFLAMKTKKLAKLQSLKMTELTSRNVRPDLTNFSNGLWQTTTLTTLTIDFGDNEDVITLRDILSSSSALTDLSYSTNGHLYDVFGDFTTWNSDGISSLISLQVKSGIITGPMIEAMLQCFPQIRRLVLYGCQFCVLDAVATHLPNLRVFACNPFSKHIPALETKDLNSSDNEEARPQEGIRVLHVNHQTGRTTFGIPAMQLIYKSMETLEVLHVDMPANNQLHLRRNYPHFDMKSIRNLTLSGAPEILPFILQSLRETGTLTSLDVRCVPSIMTIVLYLLRMRRLPAELRISDTKCSQGHFALVQLFQKYESESLNPLQNILLESCASVNDFVLEILARVGTLRQIILNDLKNVTSSGIKRIVNKSRNGNLEKLVVKRCPSVNSEVILYAKSKIQEVVYEQ
ncbi:hypothetical protein BDB00DRAFT_871490 [Zychaea mexicana]|uniref:uncharacterized protein n=1 Tax=Zychaea mexicana TaxID=64656 RepID=UPI0022FE8183|nr:uncharacterized protein BDB00DRAFT_871490 [Zychaea mexicana]KAI9494400.1 hypothetical protein BDB00DRAFT_871490 [Zychaea mexicana]